MHKLTGKTYRVRRELRALGATWDAGQRCWFVPDERAAEAQALLEVEIARRNAGRQRW